MSNRSEIGDLRIIEQIVSALNYLHTTGVIHADVKPDNLLVSGTAESPIIKIADFGLAYSDLTLTTVTQHSSNASGLGTLMYQGPECCDENSHWRTKENDVYAFALTMVEMLFPKRSSLYGEIIKDQANLIVITRLKMKATNHL